MLPDTIDELLSRIGSYSPEFGGGFSNHASMTMMALRRISPDVEADRLVSFVDRAEKRFEPWPSNAAPVDESNWKSALGDPARVADWRDFFITKLSEDDFEKVVALWAPRLAPGVMAGATHGAIRTAYAVEYLKEADIKTRRDELGIALGYWAARYQEIEDGPGQKKSDDPAALLNDIERLPTGKRIKGLIFSRVEALAGFKPFYQVRSALDVSDPADVLNRLSRCAAALYIQNDGATAISFIHCLTAAHAVRILAPFLSEGAAAGAVSYLWEAIAALYCVDSEAPWNEGKFTTGADGSLTTADEWDAAFKAAASVDTDHVIKYARSCYEENRSNPDEVYGAALSHWLAKNALL